MRARNVIISFVTVLGILVFMFIKFRLEPKRLRGFNRNPSRIEYTALALCRMECYSINANSVSNILRKGQAEKIKKRDICPVYMCSIETKQNKRIIIVIEQCGTMANILDCYDATAGAPCECVDKENRPMSYLNINH